MINHARTPHAPKASARHLFALLLGAFILHPPATLSAADTICARVKIEIKQELTLERQGFDAMMKITNGIDTNPIENVNVSVNFSDEAGNSVRATSNTSDTTAAFYIRVDTLTGINDVSGTGTVAPSSVAEIHWLIIPAPGSGGTVPAGKLYYVGATLSYSVAGKTETVVVTPDFIYVKPMPLLNLDYFLTKDVFGDDPLTTPIEPIEPYTLGVRIKNTGAATAKSVKIDSAQPRIVDNRQGLLINFQIIGSYLNDLAATPSLLIPFGDIPASSASTGRWQMTSSLMGWFTEFSATISHADELGGALTSLIPPDGIRTHFLLRDVKVDLPGRDNVRDFLVRDADGILRVYESSGLDTVVTDQSSYSLLTPAGTGPAGEALYVLSTPATAGVMFVQFTDPFSGTKALGKVTRADGKTIAPENVWLSKKRDPLTNATSYYFNLFDANTSGVYNVAIVNPAATPRPPVLQFIPDKTVTEGQQVSFLVEASDPDGTLPTISSSLLPAGAKLTAQPPAGLLARSIFDWTPGTGTSGRYPITFTASDGKLTASATTVITVGTPIPPAGPDVPVIVAPPVSTEVTVLDPELMVGLNTNPLDTATSYHFQVYADAGFQTLVAEKLNVARGLSTTFWKVPTALADNTHYYWRVRASDGTTYSSWAVGRFFVNTANDAPSAPGLATPANGTTVAVTTPTLSITGSTDPEGEAVVYGFELYADSTLTQKVGGIANLPAGAPGTISGGVTNWTVTPALSDTTLYYWRATATDPQGAKTVSAVGNFLVDTTKPAPGAPALVSPAAGSTVTTASADLTVANSLRPSGMNVSYFFEIDRAPTFASPDIVRSGARTEGTGQTSFVLTGLAENARYYWRVKVSDGLTDSPWTSGEFFVDTANDAPSVPAALNPGDNAWVTTTRPLFELGLSVDPEGDTIAYRIQVFSDVGLTTLVAERLTNGLTWLLDVPLTNETRYTWRVRAEDLRGSVSAWSPAATFLVRTGSSTPTTPTLALTAPADVVTVTGPSVTLTWEIDDPEHNSTVALFYDTDNQNADGTRIIDGLPQDATSRVGSYTWDVSALAPGTYYIYAVATNRAGSVTRYAPGAFVIPVPQPRGGITVTPITALETSENGGIASFSVVLVNSPKSDVSLGFTVTHPAEARVTPQSLVFNTANWRTAQTVTVTGLPDCLPDGDVTYQVIIGKAESLDPDYLGIKASDLTLMNRNGILGCPTNNPPLANAGPAQTVEAGAAVVLAGSGTDNDGAIVSYAWLQTAGPTVALADPTQAVTGFTAPILTGGTVLTYQLTVTDNQGATGVASVTITVKAVPNQSPTANAGAAQAAISGSTVTLTGSGTDADGTIAAYAWTQIAGAPVTLTGATTANASFVAPTVTASTVFGFQLTVTDNLGATGSATVSITVSPNQLPIVSAGVAQTVNEGAPVTLTGSATDADGTIASYVWTQTAGPAVTLANPASATTSFTAPLVTADTVLSLALTATDNYGGAATATTSVTVRNVNQPPTASAGPAQSVNEGSVATLSGSGTDSDGTIASYAWTQTAGPVVTLLNANTATASFAAPSVSVNTVLTFQLVVTDNQGATGLATTSVTVVNVNQPPTANAGANQSVNEGAAVTLTGSGTDGDGTIAGYLWTQTAGPSVTLTGATTATATFTAPQVTADTLLSFQLTVTDNLGATGSATVNVTVKNVAVALPDLAITALTAPVTSIRRGRTMTVSYTVRNLGTVPVLLTATAFYLSTDTTITTGDRLVGAGATGQIAAGASSTQSGFVLIPLATPAGTYNLGAFIDPTNLLVESNEINNTFTGPTIQVLP
jgi:hypothetical protein